MAYVWLLNEMCAEMAVKYKFIEISENPTGVFKDRMFDIQSARMKKGGRTSIKRIDTADQEIVTYYSSEELCKQLLAFIEAFNISQEYIQIIGLSQD